MDQTEKELSPTIKQSGTEIIQEKLVTLLKELVEVAQVEKEKTMDLSMEDFADQTKMVIDSAADKMSSIDEVLEEDDISFQ